MHLKNFSRTFYKLDMLKDRENLDKFLTVPFGGSMHHLAYVRGGNEL